MVYNKYNETDKKEVRAMDENISVKKGGYIELDYPALCAVIIEFTICGICGWIYETVLTSYLWGRFADRGFLHVPVLPIYGVFAFLLIPLFRRHNKSYQVFLISFFVSSVLELASAYLIEAIIHQSLWDYSSWDFNFFGGRISLYSSVIFGFLSIFLIKVVHPGTKKLTSRMPEKVLCLTGTVCWVTILADFLITLSGCFK